jgi:hypothetical protein
MKLPNPVTQRKLAEAQELPPRDGLFAAVNVGFHKAYTRVVEQVLAQPGDSVPVVVLIGDDATLLCDGGEQRVKVIPARYHELKALAHLAFGVQLTLMANGSGRLTELSASELHERRAQIREAQANASFSPTVTITPKAPAELLCRARTLVDRVLAEGAVFRRIFLPTPPPQKCGDSSRSSAAAQVALARAHIETTSRFRRFRKDRGPRPQRLVGNHE